MLSAKIDVQVTGFDDLTDRDDIAARVIPPTLEAVRDVWVRAVSGQRLPGMTRDVNEPDYAAALQDPAAIVYPDGDDVFMGAVIVPPGNGYEIAAKLERERKPRDMKPALLAGPKARRNKKGQRYNIIPLGAEPDFRTVSDKSPVNSWIYPGKLPAGVLDAVSAAVEGVIEDAVRDALRDYFED